MYLCRNISLSTYPLMMVDDRKLGQNIYLCFRLHAEEIASVDRIFLFWINVEHRWYINKEYHHDKFSVGFY